MLADTDAASWRTPTNFPACGESGCTDTALAIASATIIIVAPATTRATAFNIHGESMFNLRAYGFRLVIGNSIDRGLRERLRNVIRASIPTLFRRYRSAFYSIPILFRASTRRRTCNALGKCELPPKSGCSGVFRFSPELLNLSTAQLLSPLQCFSCQLSTFSDPSPQLLNSSTAQ